MLLSRPLGMFSLTKAGVQIGCMFVCVFVCQAETNILFAKKGKGSRPAKILGKYYDLGTFLLIIFYYATLGNSISDLPKRFAEEA